MDNQEKSQILIPISEENQIYIENVCTTGQFTFETLFEHFIDLYKTSLNQSPTPTEEEEEGTVYEPSSDEIEQVEEPSAPPPAKKKPRKKTTKKRKSK